jgi:hypothetical protein
LKISSIIYYRDNFHYNNTHTTKNINNSNKISFSGILETAVTNPALAKFMQKAWREKVAIILGKKIAPGGEGGGRGVHSGKWAAGWFIRKMYWQGALQKTPQNRQTPEWIT